jgi:hypothetical protein
MALGSKRLDKAIGRAKAWEEAAGEKPENGTGSKKKDDAETGGGKTQNRPTAIWLSAADYAYLKGLLCRQGLKLGTAIKMLIFYGAAKLEAGEITLGMAGLVERPPAGRGWG